jgi:hypothetical protein
MGNELTSFSLTPSNLKEAMEFAKIIAESDLVPKDYKGRPGNVLVAVQMGAELGVPPLQAIQGIAIINSRPAVFGDLMLALVRSSPAFESIDEQQTETEAICRVKRRGEAAITRSFTIADATKANLINKEGPWRQYPARMLRMRARSFALRDAFADILKGIAMVEEVRDIPDHIEGSTVASDLNAMASDLNARLKALADSRADVPAVPPKLAEVIEKIAAATTNAEMEQIRTLAKALPEEDIAAARDAYTARQKVLYRERLAESSDLNERQTKAGATSKPKPAGPESKPGGESPPSPEAP